MDQLDQSHVVFDAEKAKAVDQDQDNLKNFETQPHIEEYFAGLDSDVLRSPLNEDDLDFDNNDREMKPHKLINLDQAPLDGKTNTRYKQVSQSRAEETKRHNQREDLKEVRSKLIDLYLSVKIRKNEEIDVYDSI